MLESYNSLSFDEKILFHSSSGSSLSETFNELDVKNSGNQIKNQWEAIERTLYQEAGEQVTDPELLKECNLWREAFPHFRVRGTKLDVEKWNSVDGEREKNVQTLGGHINLSKIYEKREKIKSRVVGELVERLIAKFNLNREIHHLDEEASERVEGRLKITEINQKSESNSILAGSPQEKGKLSVRNGREEEKKERILSSGEKESYFERGKLLPEKKAEKDKKELSREKIEERLNEIFDSLEYEEDEIQRIAKPEMAKSAAKINNSTRGHFNRGKTEAETEKFGLGKSLPGRSGKMSERLSSDSLSNQIKPFEATKKIDRKYEKLLNKILGRTFGEPESTDHCQGTAVEILRGEPKNCQESLEKLRIKSGLDELYRRSNGNNSSINSYKTLPRITKSGGNKWLERGEIHAFEEDSFFPRTTRKPVKFPNGRGLSTLKSFPRSGKGLRLAQSEIDENFMRELKTEMESINRRPSLMETGSRRRRRRNVLPFGQEDINSRRQKLFPLAAGKEGFAPQRGLKPFDCGDPPKKEKKASSQARTSALEGSAKKEGSVKGRIKLGNSNGASERRNRRIPSGPLPPIETGIICTELTGRPKIGSKTPNAKRR